MVKLIIFDYDGTLVSCKEIHYESLNKALEEVDEKYKISIEEHISIYDGLSTNKKLALLNSSKGLPKEYNNKIYQRKQELTKDLFNKLIKYNDRLVSELKRLKSDGFKLYVASNAIRETLMIGLKNAGILELIDKVFSNEDVQNQKPSPDIFLKAMLEAGVGPDETLIVEDSKHGRESALRSKAHLFTVDSPEDISYSSITSYISNIKESKIWQDNNTNVVVPLCGSSQEFYDAGYTLPKYLINIGGKPMLQHVVDSLAVKANYIFIVKEEDYHKYNLEYILNYIAPNCKIIVNNKKTEGIVSTILLAKEFINNNSHMMITHDDNILFWDSSDFCYSMVAKNCDAGIVVFENSNPKFSYTKADENLKALEVYEKKIISNLANCGVYWFNKGSDFVKYGEQLIEKNVRVNGLFYDSMVFNEMIEDDKNVKAFKIDSMKCLGYPEDLKKEIK